MKTTLRLILFVVASFALVTALLQMPRSAEAQADDLSHDLPIEIEISLLIIDLPHIDEPAETFNIDAYLILEWNDDSTQTKQILTNETESFVDEEAQETLKEIWSPEIQHFSNQVGQKVLLNSSLTFVETGTGDVTVEYNERFQATLHSKFALEKYPFDTQNFIVEFEPFGQDIDEVLLNAAQKDGKANIKFYDDSASLEGWSVSDKIAIDINQTQSPGTDKVYSTFQIGIKADRKANLYLWKIFLPLILIIIISWSVFWIRIEPISNRLSISTIGFLTAISFGFFISGSLPDISYLTFMDGFITGIYIFMTLTVFTVLGTHFLERDGNETASIRLNRISRWAFPVAFLIYSGVIALIFLV